MMSGCSGRKSAPVDPFVVLRAEIGEQVADAKRAEEMEADVEKLELAMDELFALTAETQKALYSLAIDYESPREDFDQLFADYIENRRPIMHRMMEAHLELKSKASADEWKRLAKREHKALGQAASQSLGKFPEGQGE